MTDVETETETRLAKEDISTFLEIKGCSRQEMQTRGEKVLSRKDSLFTDLIHVVDHPLLKDFAQKYFKTWQTTCVITQLCRLYMELDQLSQPIHNPFEKLTVLKNVIWDNYVEANRLILPPPSRSSVVKEGQALYQTHPILKDVADIMEYKMTSKVIQKYFLQWDTGDLVVVLIQLYQCLDQCTDWTPVEKMGFLHYLMSDRQTRQILSTKVNEWKENKIYVQCAWHEFRRGTHLLLDGETKQELYCDRHSVSHCPAGMGLAVAALLTQPMCSGSTYAFCATAS
jgi:hypothetical protein